MRIGAVPFARMESSRLPGKAMADLWGRPLIGWLVHKARALPFVDEIVVATTTLPSDDVIEDYFKPICSVYRGDPDCSLNRILDCANLYEFTHMLTLTGDSPFADPELMTTAVTLAHDFPDYDTYAPYTHTMPDAHTEGLAASAMSVANLQRTMDYFHSLPPDIQLKHLDTPTLAGNFHYIPRVKTASPTFISETTTTMKLSIDYPAELLMARAMCRCLGRFPRGWADIEWAYKNMGAEHFTDPS